jgi:hypothetical protein
MKTVAATVFFAAILAGACSLAVGSPPVQVFHDVAVKPAHAAAPLDAIAEKFCRDEGFAAAGGHLFVGFTGSGGSITAHFRQISCRTYHVRKLEKSSGTPA